MERKIAKISRLVLLVIAYCLLLSIITVANGKGIAGERSALAASRNAAWVQQDLSSSESTIANCRYGVVAGYGEEVNVPKIGAGLFLDFNPPVPPKPEAANGAEYAHMLLVFQNKTPDGLYLPSYRTEIPLDKNLAAFIQANPGDLWIIGNEVDRGPNPDKVWSGQGDMYPEMYARAFHDVSAFIKRQDPSARIAMAGLVQVTPGRLQYLDMVWEAYERMYHAPMPVDVWTMHIYIMPEVEPDGLTPNGIASVALGTDPTLAKRSSGGDARLCDDPDVYCFAEHDNMEIFAEQVIAMRRWMKDRGQQKKPLILSEFSLLYPNIDDGDTCFLQDEYGNCFTPQRVSHFMNEVFAYLNTLKREDLGFTLDGNRLVQQWVWFSMYTNQAGNVSNIMNSDDLTLSPIGQNFRQQVFAEGPIRNLLVEGVPRVVAIADPATGRATANLRVYIRSNGNTAVNEPFEVTFYLDPGRTKPFGSLTVNDMIRGCATRRYVAEFPWRNLRPGFYQYWLDLDTGDVIVETTPTPSDNLGYGEVLVTEKGVYLPVFTR